MFRITSTNNNIEYPTVKLEVCTISSGTPKMLLRDVLHTKQRAHSIAKV